MSVLRKCLGCWSDAEEIDAPTLVLDFYNRKPGAEEALIAHVADVKGCAVAPKSGVSVCARRGKKGRKVVVL